MVAIGLLLMSGGFVLVALPLWWSRTPRPERRPRRATVWIERGVIYVGRGPRRHAIALDEVASVRSVEDVAMLFNGRGRLLMRVPSTAYGFGDLRDVLARCGVESVSLPMDGDGNRRVDRVPQRAAVIRPRRRV